MARVISAIKDELGKISKWPWSVYNQTADDGEGGFHLSSPDPENDWVAQSIYKEVDADFLMRAPERLKLLVEYVEASEAFRGRRHMTSEEVEADWKRMQQARAALGLSA